MHRHLSTDLVEQYIIGALDAESSRFVEGHVAMCPACAKALQKEAAVELALFEVASRGSVVSLAARKRRVGAVVASVAAALAAAAAVVLVNFESEGTVQSAPTLRKCVDSSTMNDCLTQAQFDGVLSVDSRGELVVPRYDVTPETGTP